MFQAFGRLAGRRRASGSADSEELRDGDVLEADRPSGIDALARLATAFKTTTPAIQRRTNGRRLSESTLQKWSSPLRVRSRPQVDSGSEASRPRRGSQELRDGDVLEVESETSGRRPRRGSQELRDGDVVEVESESEASETPGPLDQVEEEAVEFYDSSGAWRSGSLNVWARRQRGRYERIASTPRRRRSSAIASGPWRCASTTRPRRGGAASYGRIASGRRRELRTDRVDASAPALARDRAWTSLRRSAAAARTPRSRPRRATIVLWTWAIAPAS